MAYQPTTHNYSIETNSFICFLDYFVPCNDSFIFCMICIAC